MAGKRRKHYEFNDGIAEIYSVSNAAEVGERPKDKLTLKRKVRFKIRIVGVKRFYEAMQNQIRIDKMILIPMFPEVTTQDAVRLTSDSVLYRAEQVQQRPDTLPPTTQISLSAMDSGEESKDGEENDP